MHKKWIVALLVVALLVCGCSVVSGPSSSSLAQRSGPPMDCKVGGLIPASVDPQSINLAPISDADWSRGPEDAAITLLVYSDFQCPACSQAAPAIKQFEDANPGQVREIYRNFPLSQHDKAILAAQAAEAAGLQGKFWEMHDFLFDADSWTTWTSMTPGDFEDWLYQQVPTVGLDLAQFKQDLNSDAVVAKVQEEQQQAQAVNLTQTPTLIVFFGNDLVFTPQDQVPYDTDTLQALLSLSKIRPLQYKTCPPTIIDPAKSYTATIQTEIGDIKVKLYPDKAPLAVNNFVFLATHGFYDGTTFHRVISGYIAQGGDPSGTGLGDPGYQFANEVSDDLTFDQAGLLAMANAGADTNGSQFFITFAPATQLNGNYTIFGEVIEGMDVAEKLTPRDPNTTPASSLPAGTLIKTIHIEEN